MERRSLGRIESLASPFPGPLTLADERAKQNHQAGLPSEEGSQEKELEDALVHPSWVSVGVLC